MTEQDKRSRNERIKEQSRQLRGTIAEGLGEVVTGAISEDDAQLTKFHGTYLQDHRDLRGERTKKKLEKAFSFMIRLRLPGGLVSPEQWLKLDHIAGTYSNGSLRLTTRATFQYHGVIKSNLRRTMQAINDACLDTIAACGDVNRNVMCVANPFFSPAHAAAVHHAVRVTRPGVAHAGENDPGNRENRRRAGARIQQQDDARRVSGVVRNDVAGGRRPAPPATRPALPDHSCLLRLDGPAAR